MMARKLPLISFVVVTHDRPIELVMSRIMQSIALQDYPRLEIVLVGEDCPHLPELAKTIRDHHGALNLRFIDLPRPSNMRHLPRSFVARARNRGVAAARGDFISCQDDDNELAMDFSSSLLECILSEQAEAVWCHRRLVMPDGSLYPGTFFPWAEPLTPRERAIYEIWRDAGVIEPGSDVFLDKLVAVNLTEVFSTVDANEWLVRAELLRQFPFRERFGVESLRADISFDDIWNQEIRSAGVKAVCTERVSLTYHLGGLGNCEFVNRWIALRTGDSRPQHVGWR